MNIKEITSKTALSPSKLPGLDYALNPYLGCGHQCAYCYVPTVLHLPRDVWEETISVKRNLPLVLSKELAKKKPGTIGISTVTDPYQPIEKTYQITKYCLEQLLNYDFPIIIQTKSDLVLRDIKLIEQFSTLEVMMSIGTNDENHRAILEPKASSIQQRINVLDELKNNQHIKTSVFLGPLYPNMNWEDVKELLDLFIKKNISTIMIDNLHLKPGLQNHLSSTLQQNLALYQGFNCHVFNSSDWYQKMALLIKEYMMENASNINVTQAF